jgi:hypothetical protein
VLVTDTVAVSPAPPVEMRSVTSLLADAIRRLHDDDPLEDLLPVRRTGRAIVGPRTLGQARMSRSHRGVLANERRCAVMIANVGDRIIVRGYQVGNPNRAGVVIEVHGSNGEPPYLVRWSDGHEGVYVPGPDAIVEHAPPSESAS